MKRVCMRIVLRTISHVRAPGSHNNTVVVVPVVPRFSHGFTSDKLRTHAAVHHLYFCILLQLFFYCRYHIKLIVGNKHIHRIYTSKDHRID